MGKQVGFYMTESDEAGFIQFVRSDRNVAIICDTLPTAEISLDAGLPERSAPGWFSVWLWDRDNSSVPKIDYVPKQRYYTVDFLNSEVIEFSRCNFDDDRLVRGRIWAEMATWEKDGTLLVKSEAFVKWFDRLANWIKRHSVRDDRGDYVMPGAAEYAKQGGKLVQAVFAKSVKHYHHEIDEPKEKKEQQNGKTGHH